MLSVIHYTYTPSVYLSYPHLFLASVQSQFFGNGKRSCVNADPKKKHKKIHSAYIVMLMVTHEFILIFWNKNLEPCM